MTTPSLEGSVVDTKAVLGEGALDAFDGNPRTGGHQSETTNDTA